MKAEYCKNTEFDFELCFSFEFAIASGVIIFIAFALQIVGCSCFLEKAQVGGDAQVYRIYIFSDFLFFK